MLSSSLVLQPLSTMNLSFDLLELLLQLTLNGQSALAQSPVLVAVFQTQKLAKPTKQSLMRLPENVLAFLVLRCECCK